MEGIGEAEGVIVPLRAKVVKVTNVLDPFHMRMYDTKEYNEKTDNMCKKLLSLHQKGLLDRLKIPKEPEYNDYVAISVYWNYNIDLPAFWCRGVVCCDGPVDSKYTIMLIDYGICIKLWKDGFIIIPKSLVPEPSVSRTISVGNILPLCSGKGISLGEERNGEDRRLRFISDNWLPDAIEWTKDLITAADEIFFDYFYTDANEVEFGELFLVLEQEVIRLSDALVASHFAARVDKNFLRSMRDPESLEKRIIDGKTFYCLLKNSKEVKGISPRRPLKSESQKGMGKRIIEQQRQKVLIFTKTPCGILTSVSEAKFPTEIHMAWNDMTRSSRPKTLQAYIWPAIKKGLDVLAIGTKSSGKTLGVTMAVCGLVAATKHISKGKEPMAAIFCASSSEVLKVYEFCLELLREYNKINMVAAINGKTDRSLVAEMFNGCQILITTPNFFSRFQSRYSTFFTWEKLQYLVFDNADVTFKKYDSSIRKILQVILYKTSRMSNKCLQIIKTARHWTTQLNSFRPLLKNPYVCIASFLEAVVFKSVRPQLLFMKSSWKAKHFIDIVGERFKLFRTVVVCANASESEKLNSLVLEVHKRAVTLLVHEETRIDKTEGIKSCWHAAVKESYPMLITTDEALSDLNITNADWLIHYSISLSHKTRFNFRHSTLCDNLLKDSQDTKVTIFADENNDVQFQSIVSMMQRMKFKLSPEMERNLKLMAVTLDQKKWNRSICNKTKSLGFCPEQNSCPFRHCILEKVDDPLTNIQINDRVKLMVICLHNASHMSARIISYIDSNTREEIQFPNTDYVDLYAKMRRFYAEIENRRACRSINVGDVCSFEETLDDFKRVRIIHVEQQEGADKPNFVNVRCIDNGIVTEQVKPFKLLQLPEHLRKLPCHIVDVFLSDIAPQDDEYDWDSTATRAVRNWFKDNVDEHSYVTGTVQLHLSDTIWLNTLEVGTKVVGYSDLIGSSLKEELLKNEIAVVNKDHMTKLQKLCAIAGYSYVNGVGISTSTESDTSTSKQNSETLYSDIM